MRFVMKLPLLLDIVKTLESRNNNLEYFVSFLRKERFHVPDKPNISIRQENDIMHILPKPLFRRSVIKKL